MIHTLGGNFAGHPGELADHIDRPAQELIEQSFEGVDRSRLVDCHIHLIGMQSGSNGAFVNSRMFNWRYPFHRLKAGIFMSAAGVSDGSIADQQYFDRLLSLSRAISPKLRFHLLAFDKHYNGDGSVNLHKTEFYTPNDYMWRCCQEYPELFVPVMSVHPYRDDAIEELEKWACKGVAVVKWLPNAMGIDPADQRCVPFYDKMRERNLTLLCHVAEEQAVEAREDQLLGNPLLLRTPLECGVVVVAAHAGSLGSNPDLDRTDRRRTANLALLLRMMDTAKYAKQLYADISAVTQFNRLKGQCLTQLLDRTDLHARFINGSDYPLPAINMIISTRLLKHKGYISRQERQSLNQIYRYNPLLFDFVLKRTLRSPETGKQFDPSIFN